MFFESDGVPVMSSDSELSAGMEEPIDVVITWVDGDDPVIRKKRFRYLENTELEKFDDTAGETRYRSVGEIKYCVGAILRFAPFVRQIFIITDNQDPHLEEFLAKNFPDNAIPVKIVDHKVVFRGYEHLLPTFNAVSIESMMFRIPGLSERFVFLNDDFFIIAPVKPEDWFQNGRPVIYGCWRNTLVEKFRLLVHGTKDGRKIPLFKRYMLNALPYVGGMTWWRFWRTLHVPLALLKSEMEDFYDKHPGLLERNASYRFRDYRQFNPQTLFHNKEAQRKNPALRERTEYQLYLQPWPKHPERVRERIEAETAHPRFTWCCFNSLDLMPSRDRDFFLDWLARRIGIEI